MIKERKSCKNEQCETLKDFMGEKVKKSHLWLSQCFLDLSSCFYVLFLSFLCVLSGAFSPVCFVLVCCKDDMQIYDTGAIGYEYASGI